MQIGLKIALAAAGFALATVPTFAVEMPTDGSKNFSPPADAPGYFANEAVPESARVANPATFTDEDVADTHEDVAVVPMSGRILRSRRNPSGTASTLTVTNLRGTLRADPRDMAARPATPNRRRRKPTRTAALHGAAKSTQTAGSRDLFAHPLEENLGAGSIRSSV